MEIAPMCFRDGASRLFFDNMTFVDQCLVLIVSSRLLTYCKRLLLGKVFCFKSSFLEGVIRSFSKFFHCIRVYFTCRWVLNSRKGYERGLWSLFMEKQVTIMAFQGCSI